jgi:hypothetical protein
MSEDEENKLACADKLVFDTKKEAETARITADWQHGVTLKAYQCKDCQLWHLSSS